MSRVATIAITVLISAVGFVEAAQACSCESYSFEASLRRSGTIYVGELVSFDTRLKKDSSGSYVEETARLKVTRAYKGVKVGDIISITTPTSSGFCEPSFIDDSGEAIRRWLIFDDQIAPCSRSRPFPAGGNPPEDIEKLDRVRGR